MVMRLKTPRQVLDVGGVATGLSLPRVMFRERSVERHEPHAREQEFEQSSRSAAPIWLLTGLLAPDDHGPSSPYHWSGRGLARGSHHEGRDHWYTSTCTAGPFGRGNRMVTRSAGRGPEAVRRHDQRCRHHQTPLVVESSVARTRTRQVSRGCAPRAWSRRPVRDRPLSTSRRGRRAAWWKIVSERRTSMRGEARECGGRLAQEELHAGPVLRLPANHCGVARSHADANLIGGKRAPSLIMTPSSRPLGPLSRSFASRRRRSPPDRRYREEGGRDALLELVLGYLKPTAGRRRGGEVSHQREADSRAVGMDREATHVLFTPPARARRGGAMIGRRLLAGVAVVVGRD